MIGTVVNGTRSGDDACQDGSGQDIRDLIGLRSRFATGLVALYIFTCFLCAAATLDGVSSPWPIFVSAGLCSIGAITMITAPGDPLPWRYTAFIAALGPVSCALTYSVIPVPVSSPLQTWPLGTSVALFTALCVRGRTSAAWAGLGTTVAVTIFWSVQTGQGAAYGIAFGVINAAPLLMSTFFAFTLRPLARSVFALRDQSTTRVASEAAAAAVLEERDSQLRRLDELARPLLERTVHGPDLAPEEIASYTLLEAELRDSLRARALVTDRLRTSVRTARDRGVSVVLLDDRADVELDTAVRDLVVDSAAEHIDRMPSGSATLRLLPAGRPALATMLVDSERTYRIEYEHDGRAHEISN